LTDRYNRNINYLRISVTDHCNLNCIYCSPANKIIKLPRKEILKYEEILRLVKIGVNLGIYKVRITGGEPLIRKNLYDFLNQLTLIDGLKDVSLTTNGVLLKDNIDKIKASGIERINISLDTLNRKKYHYITGADNFKNVWEGIEAAQSKGFKPIKLNVVALNGVNDDELEKFAKLSISYPFHIRFIEYMPFGSEDINQTRSLLTNDMKQIIKKVGRFYPVEKNETGEPVEPYKFENSKGQIGFISPLSRHFCSRCNRLRLTASGMLRPCLLSDNQIDIKGPLRSDASDRELGDIFVKAVHFKPYEHNIICNKDANISGRMRAIGG